MNQTVAYAIDATPARWRALLDSDMSAPDRWLISTQPADDVRQVLRIKQLHLAHAHVTQQIKKALVGDLQPREGPHGVRQFLGLELVRSSFYLSSEGRQVLRRPHTERREGPARVRQSLTREGTEFGVGVLR